ncbi:MAG: InlB B-repeat-containing protein [Acholeplasmatales bacterium]|jgi:M6 family metalloprotease-like protein/uncharacterized repeat protein (TIGR02543 family)|nr:InlB B-repeat-containing protein [Acholeplasmatales bacterium]
MKKCFVLFVLLLLVAFSCTSGVSKVSFYVDDSLYFSISSRSINKDFSKVPTEPTKEGYNFVGWFVDENFLIPFDTSYYEKLEGDLDLKVYAKFEREIFFSLDGFILNNGFYEKNVSNATKSLDFKTLSSYESDINWCISRDQTFVNSFIDNVVSLSLGENYFFLVVNDSDLITSYSIKVYRNKLFSVSFLDATEGLYGIYLVEEGTLFNYDIPTYTPKLGYYFVNWDYDFSETISSDLTVRPILAYKFYEITYVLNGGVNDILNPTHYTFENHVLLKDAYKEGYLFAGWYLDVYLENASIETIECIGDVTLYAKFIPLNLEEIALDIISTIEEIGVNYTLEFSDGNKVIVTDKGIYNQNNNANNGSLIVGTNYDDIVFWSGIYTNIGITGENFSLFSLISVYEDYLKYASLGVDVLNPLTFNYSAFNSSFYVSDYFYIKNLKFNLLSLYNFEGVYLSIFDGNLKLSFIDDEKGLITIDITDIGTSVISYAIVFYDETSEEPLEYIGQRARDLKTLNEVNIELTGRSGIPAIGNVRILIVPIEFPNDRFTATELNNLNLVFNGTSVDTGFESVTSYYYKSSYGKLNYTFDIAPAFLAPKNSSQYHDNEDQALGRLALNAIDDDYDFSLYDNNDDGYIDSVIYVYSRSYSSGLWWAYCYYYYSGSYYYDSKRLFYYQWVSIDFMKDSISGYPGLKLDAETYIHETGHLMGLPDYYDYNDYQGPRGGVGGFDMMDYNAGDHGPFNKSIFGWIEPVVITSINSTYVLNNYEETGDAIILTKEWKNTFFDEYLIIMYYTPDGLYRAHKNLSYVPDYAGIVIYHIDGRLLSSANDWDVFQYDNSYTSHKLVKIVEVDKNNSIENGAFMSNSDYLRTGTFNNTIEKWYVSNQIINLQITINVISSSSVVLEINFY